MPHRWRFVRTVKHMLAENLLRPIPPNETTSARHDNSAQRGLTTCKSRAMQRVSSGSLFIGLPMADFSGAFPEARSATRSSFPHCTTLLAFPSSFGQQQFQRWAFGVHPAIAESVTRLSPPSLFGDACSRSQCRPPWPRARWPRGRARRTWLGVGLLVGLGPGARLGLGLGLSRCEEERGAPG